jgi:hypothetical protein
MLPLAGRIEGLVRSFLRRLPLSDYQKTRLWATSLPRPRGRVQDWSYYRCVELATRGFATSEGYAVAFPGAGNPDSAFSMLEFGVANGHSFQVLLHFRDVWLKRLHLENKVMAVGFDTFEGIPAARQGDVGLLWREGDFTRVDLDSLQTCLDARFNNFRLVKGQFKDTLPQYDLFLREHPPVFVSIDCDYYSSTMDVFGRLLPDIAPHGCLFYFDDVGINFWSDKTGELRAIAEVNTGKFGSHISLVEYPLWIETREMRHYKQVYRLFNLEAAEKLRRSRPPCASKQVTRSTRISPL